MSPCARGNQHRLSSIDRSRDVNVWLLTWEGTTGPAVNPDKKIIAILSSRLSDTVIANIVDVFYCRCVDSAFDMVSAVNKRKQRESKYRHCSSTSSRFFYGSFPCLIFARRVTSFRIERDLHGNSELLRWRELPTFQNAPLGSGIVEQYPAEEREHLRSLRPLSVDLSGADA